MKIRLLLLVCFIIVKGACFAQNDVTNDSLQTTGKNLENAKKPVIPSGRTILADMKTNNPEMYLQYRSGKKMQRTGIIMSGVGGGFLLAGAIFSIIPDGEGTVSVGGIDVGKTDADNSGLRKAGPILMVGGATCLAVGLPVMIVGGKKKKQTFQDFKNQYYSSQQPSSYFQMNLYSSRVGVAYVF
jgi:hypothetical protein